MTCNITFFNALKTFRKMLETADYNNEGLNGEPRRGTTENTF